jgi:mannose-6-phosphate isomerase-like protein (cupin superfamily)
MKITTTTAEHYRWGDNCDGWHLLKSSELSVILERMPPRTKEVRHYHERSLQLFVVMSGRLTIEIGTTRLVLHKAEAVEIRPGTVHQVRNDSDQVAWFIVTSQPPSHGDRILAPELSMSSTG